MWMCKNILAMMIYMRNIVKEDHIHTNNNVGKLCRLIVERVNEGSKALIPLEIHFKREGERLEM
jgi:hypothetical protein